MDLSSQFFLTEDDVLKGNSRFIDVYVCVCVLCVAVWCVAVWCSGCVLGSGTLPAPPVHPAVIGYLAFAGVQIQGLFS